jgi:hypothetical protein
MLKEIGNVKENQFLSFIASIETVFERRDTQTDSGGTQNALA